LRRREIKSEDDAEVMGVTGNIGRERAEARASARASARESKSKSNPETSSSSTPVCLPGVKALLMALPANSNEEKDKSESGRVTGWMRPHSTQSKFYKYL
jgi:hypothetical protein